MRMCEAGWGRKETLPNYHSQDRSMTTAWEKEKLKEE